MIVTCAECDTQFKLDDSKVVGTGLNVRCSVCKHAFFVEAPGHAVGEVDGAANEPVSAIDRIAGAAIDAAFSDEPGAIPEATQDLATPDSESSSDDEIVPAAALSLNADEGMNESGENSESDWEFSLDPDHAPGTPAGIPQAETPTTGKAAAAKLAVDHLLSPAPTPSPTPSPTAAPTPAPTPQAKEEGKSLGDPETSDPGDWDFFGNEGEDLSAGSPKPPPAAAPVQAASPASAAAIAPGEGVGAPQPLDPGVSSNAFGAERSTGVEAPADAQSAFPEYVPARPASRALGRVGNAIGWFFVVALFTLGLHSGMRIQRLAPAHLETQQVGGAIVESVEGQWIENILAGPLFVVSGTLREAGGGSAASRSVIVLRLYDADGRPLDSASAMVGPALSEQQIREGDPEELIARLELGASRISSEPLAKGETRRFNAILREVPTSAASFRLESAPLSLDVP